MVSLRAKGGIRKGKLLLHLLLPIMQERSGVVILFMIALKMEGLLECSM